MHADSLSELVRMGIKLGIEGSRATAVGQSLDLTGREAANTHASHHSVLAPPKRTDAN